MGFRDLDLKETYDSDEDDILRGFYIPVLSEAVKYRRLAGFFSSTSLAVAARGIAKFLANNGTMELIAGARLSQRDVDAINSGSADSGRILTDNFIRDLDSVADELERNHVRALGWLVAQGRLNIKIAIPLGKDGRPLSEVEVERSDLFHQKVGILFDSNNDVISFSGSINETAFGWTRHIEEFKTFRSWIEDQKIYLESDRAKFEKFWEGHAENTLTTDVPTAIRERLIMIAPESVGDLQLNPPTPGIAASRASRKRLRDYQEEAIRCWKTSNYAGILAMATGTGKTLVALRAVLSLVPDNSLVVIAVPTEVLASQWRDVVREEAPSAYSVICDADNPGWPERLSILAGYIDAGDEDSKRCFAIATYNTTSSNKFTEIIGRLIPAKLCLVADEVHHAGAPVFSKILDCNFGYRLGLSATPERLWDEIGSGKILDFFGGVVFEYSLDKALKDSVLCEYEYHIAPVILKTEELEEYHVLSSSLSTKISQILKSYPYLRGSPIPKLMAEISRVNPTVFQSLQALMIRRTNILKRAAGKSDALRQIVREGYLGRCLIYCNDQDHLQEVLRTLYNTNISALKYDSSMSTDERARNLGSFSAGGEGFLVAIKCLDEGVDIPDCDSAILISSAKSTREYVQRRGRLLRRAPGKVLARIYDLIILPIDPDSSAGKISALEFQLLETEIKRANTFASSALNGAEVMLKLRELEASLSSRISS